MYLTMDALNSQFGNKSDFWNESVDTGLYTSRALLKVHVQRCYRSLVSSRPKSPMTNLVKLETIQPLLTVKTSSPQPRKNPPYHHFRKPPICSSLSSQSFWTTVSGKSSKKCEVLPKKRCTMDLQLRLAELACDGVKIYPWDGHLYGTYLPLPLNKINQM